MINRLISIDYWFYRLRTSDIGKNKPCVSKVLDNVKGMNFDLRSDLRLLYFAYFFNFTNFGFFSVKLQNSLIMMLILRYGTKSSASPGQADHYCLTFEY